MADDRARYTDEWLDEKFVWVSNEIQRLWRSLDELPVKQVQMEAELRAVRDDTSDCMAGVDKVNATLDRQAEERKAERVEARKEKRQDRTLIITTAIGCGGLIVAAIQVLSGGSP